MLVHFLSKGRENKFPFLVALSSSTFSFIILEITRWLLQTTDDVITVMASDHGCLPTLALWEQHVPKFLPLSHGYHYSHGFVTGRAQTILIPCLSFLGPNEINCLYCADPPLFILPCSDMYVNMTAMFAVAGFNLCCSLTPSSSPLTFLFSQPFCVNSSVEGRPKAFSSSGSHLQAVTLFYGCSSAYIGGLLLKHL